MKLLRRAADYISLPVLADFPTFIFLVLLMATPASLAIEMPLTHFRPDWFAWAVPQSVVFAWILCWILVLRPTRFWRAIVLSLPIIFCFSEFFCFFFFGSRLGKGSLALMLQTNANETSGFFQTYLPTPKTLWISIGFIIALSLYCISVKRYRPNRDGKIWVGLATIPFLLMGLIMIIATLTGSRMFPLRYYTRSCTPIQIAGALLELREESPDLPMLREAHRDIASSASDPLPLIVFILGESHNRNHNIAYGYQLPTTPTEMDEIKAGNLCVFTDIVTPYKYTHEVMQAMFSTASSDSTFLTSPLFPALFKNAGYKVCYYDNQFTPAGITAGLDYLMDPELSKANFSSRNSEIFQYDGSLVDKYLPTALSSSAPTLVIFHFGGEHLPARTRYPREEGVFTAGNYSARKDLTDKQRRDIADYDNAIRYTDSQLRRIYDSVRNRDAIVIYTSDHGEEVYDFRLQYGRTFADVDSCQAHSIFEVPLEIWMSPEFRKKRPELTNKITEAAGRPGFNTHLAHTLLEIGNIKSPFFNPKLSIINSGYEVPKPRILWSGWNYDEDRKL